MNQLYTTAAAIRAQGAEAGFIHEAKKPRYHLRAGLQYLFYDGSKLTSDRAYAWTGTVEQARKARKAFDAAAGCKLRSIQTIPVHSEEEA